MGDPPWLSKSSEPDKPALTNGTQRCTSFKVILVGEAGVGKTTLFSRIHQPDQVPSDTLTAPSIGVDTCTRTVCTRGSDVTLSVWDTAGAEKYRTLTRNYHRNSQAALLVFSVDDPTSLYSLSAWQRDVSHSSPSAVHFLVGNKSDLAHQVTDQSLRCFAQSHNCQAAFVISAKTGEGVEAALSAICDHLATQTQHHSRMYNRDRLWLQGSGIQVHGKDNRSKCCS